MNTNKKLFHKYEMWAWAYPDHYVTGMEGSCMTWRKTIYRVNPITPRQKDKLLTTFCGKIIDKHNCSLGLDGMNYLGTIYK